MKKMAQSRREFLGSVAAISMSSIITSCKKERTIHLENKALAVTIGAHGEIRALHNRLTGEHHDIDSVEFAIVSDRGSASSDQMRVTGIKQSGAKVEVALEGQGYKSTVHYELGEAWIEKWVTFSSNKDLVLKRIVMGQRRFTPQFQEIYAHSDNTEYNVPINWFLRTGKGGWYAGIEFPFTMNQKSGADRLELAYGGWRTSLEQPKLPTLDMIGDHPFHTEVADLNVKLKPGEEFVSEKEFLGVYKNTGHFREKALTGTPRIITTIPERLDWGEVWAMQDFMRHVLPELPKTHDGFELYMNGWWAGLPQEPIAEKDVVPYEHAIDLSKQFGVGMFGYASFWLGMARFIKRSGSFVMNVGKDLSFSLSQPARKVMEYLIKRGMTLGGCSEGMSHYREDRPDWKLVEKDGKKPGQLCWANLQAADWFFKLHSKVLSQYKVIKLWVWDGGWLPGNPEVSLDWDCYSQLHGHPPGNVGYLEYKNVISIFQRLREQHPDVALGVCWAVKCGGPWALRYLDTHENYYENQGPDDLRFQMWYNQNSSFIPCSKNMAQVWFKFIPSKMKLSPNMRDYWKIWYTPSTRDYRYGFMSALSGGVDLGFMVQLPKFESAEEKDAYLGFMNKWRQWASENLIYLKEKRDIFGQPLRKNGIDGSAHILNDRGFIFVFNPTEKRHIGRIPLDKQIRLESGDQFEVRIIYPENGSSLGTYKYAESVLVDIPPGNCKLLELIPHKGEAIRKLIPQGADVQDAI